MKGTIVKYSKHRGYGFIRISLDEILAAKDTAINKELMPTLKILRNRHSHLDSFFHYSAAGENVRPLLKKGKEVEVSVAPVPVPRTHDISFKVTDVEKVY